MILPVVSEPDVPLLDLPAQYASLREHVLPRLMEVIDSQRFVLGPAVTDFERRAADYCGTRHAVSCANGTDALVLSLRTLDLEPGDEIVTTPFSFFATAGAIALAGATPVFVDIEPDSFNIDPTKIGAALTDRTRAILPVDLFGQMARLEDVVALGRTRDIAVIEDAAQAFGARRRIDGTWVRAGAGGSLGTFSFFPSKNLGGWGDGGLIVTDDEDRAARLRRLREHGAGPDGLHAEVGTNSRLDALQAVVLNEKLSHLDAWCARRRARAERYIEAFSGLDGIVSPTTTPGNEHIFHQFTIRVDRRDALRARLAARGIGHAVYYPTPLHLQPCFARLGYRRGSLPGAERASAEVVSLPIYPELTDEQQDRVIAAVRECCESE